MIKKYLLGKPEDFHNFVNSIEREDKIGIVTHTDVDGLISGIFLEKILKSKGLKINFMEFINYGEGILKPILKKEFDILFFTDCKADEYLEDLENLRKKGRVLVVDHHPLNEDLKDKKGIIKTESKYCSAHVLFDLAKKYGYFNTKEWEWLVCAAIVLDYTFNDDLVFNFLKEHYPGINKKSIFESVPGKIGKKIDNALIYYRPDFKKVYDLILKNDLDFLDEVNKIVEEDISKNEKRYLKEAEYFPDKNFYFSYFTPKIARVSTIISKISHENPDKIFFMAADSSREGIVKVSSRAQSGKIDLNKLCKKCIKGFDNASAGGHKQAAGGSFPKKYLGEFKKRLLEEI